MPLDISFYNSLPKKRMAAGCLFLNEQGRILLVKPNYKPVWEIPGGVVELNESPWHGCQREVQEEIGLKHKIGDLLVVDYNSQTSSKTESLMFIFNGGVLSLEEIVSIKLQPDELSDFCFYAPDALPAELTETLRARILAAWQQISEARGIYLENQQRPELGDR